MKIPVLDIGDLLAVSVRQVGLAGMRERLTLVEGTFSASAAPDRGAIVAATVPLGQL